MSDERPNEKMSVEEHSVLTTLTRNVSDLTSSVRSLTENQGRLDKIVTQLAAKSELSWKKMGELLMTVLAVLGPVGLLLSMKMDNRVAPLERDASVAGIQQASDHSALLADKEEIASLKARASAAHDEFVRTNTAQDIYLALLWRAEFHQDPPSVPLTR